VIKQKDGRRNRYQVQAHLPLPEAASQEPAIGEVLALLTGNRPDRHPELLIVPHGPRRRDHSQRSGCYGCATPATLVSEPLPISGRL